MDPFCSDAVKRVNVCLCLQVMTAQERDIIVTLKKCNFKELAEYFKLKSEERKNMSKEEKQVCAISFSISESKLCVEENTQGDHSPRKLGC